LAQPEARFFDADMRKRGVINAGAGRAMCQIGNRQIALHTDLL
jgi:hypothetical protein